MKKSSKSNNDLLSEEKSDENSNKNSSEEKKDDESDGDKLSREEISDESDEDKSNGEEKVMKVKVSNQMKKKKKGLNPFQIMSKLFPMISINLRLIWMCLGLMIQELMRESVLELNLLSLERF